MAVAGLVLGVLSIVTSFIYIGVVLGILGLIFSCIANGKEKSGMSVAGMICSIIGIALSIFMIALAPQYGEKTGTSSSWTVAADSTADSLIEGSAEAESENTQSTSNLADQMDTTLYYGADSSDYGKAALYVKNNADFDVDIEVTFTEKDADGNAIGSSSDLEYSVASGQDVLLLGLFDSYKENSSCEYSMKVTESSMYSSMHDAVSLTENATDDGLVFTATNNADKDAYFVRVKAVFLKNGNLADTGETYLVNASDSALNPGQTLSGEIYSIGVDYDDVIYTYTARNE